MDTDTNTFPPMSPALARRAADRFSREPDFLGHRLAESGRSRADLCAALACTEETLDHLRICFAPRDLSDVAELAERFGVDGAALADLTLPGVVEAPAVTALRRAAREAALAYLHVAGGDPV